MRRGHPSWPVVVAAAFVVPVQPARAETLLEAGSAGAVRPVADVSGPLPVSVRINGIEATAPCLVVEIGRALFLRTSDLAAWGIIADRSARLTEVGGETYADAATLTGLSAQLDPGRSTVSIDADPQVYPALVLGPAEPDLPVGKAITVAYLDYDLSITSWDGAVGGSAFLNPGLSGNWGVFDTTLLASSGNGLVRLDSAFIRDLPDRRARLVVGDTLSAGSGWSQPLRFAGVRFGTDFALDPGLDSRPYIALSGSTTLPSTVSLISAALRDSKTIGPGAFRYDFRPQIDGLGEVTMTVRDVAGNERAIKRRFYSSGRLLRPGLWDYSFEAGMLRRGYGQRSFDYGSAYAALGARTGVSNRITLGARLEATRSAAAGGLDAAAVIGSLGEIALSVAGSRDATGSGLAYRAGFQRVSSAVSLSASYYHADGDFRQPGDGAPREGPIEEWALGSNLSLGQAGSVNFGWVDSRRSGARTRVVSSAWSGNLGPGYVALGGQYLATPDSETLGLFATLSMPLGQRRQVSLDAGSDHLLARLQRAAPDGQGLEYHAAAGKEFRPDGTWLEGGATLNTRAGSLSVDAVRRRGSTGLRARAAGAVVLAGGQLRATPRLEYGMVLVSLDSDATVTLSLENRPVAATVGAGKTALVTGLQPYAANHLSIDRDALPITQADNLDDQVVVPGWRKAVRAQFGTVARRPLRLRVVDEGGTALPAGLDVVAPKGEPGVTGNDGEVFLADAQSAFALRIGGANGCTVNVEPGVGDGLSEATPAVCHPIPAKERR